VHVSSWYYNENGLLRALRDLLALPGSAVEKRKPADLPPQALDGKRALVRVDFNVPLKNGKITDDNHGCALAPDDSIFREKGARVVLLSHLGRPKGGPIPSTRSSKSCATWRSCSVRPSSSFPIRRPASPRRDGCARRRRARRKHAVWPGEEKNDPELRRCSRHSAISSERRVWVGASRPFVHRAVAHLLKPAVTGFLMEKELTYLGQNARNPKHPCRVLGGAKISGKIDVIRSLLPRVEELLIGGAMACTFFGAMGPGGWGSLVEPDRIALAKTCSRQRQKTDSPARAVIAPSTRARERASLGIGGRDPKAGPSTTSTKTRSTTSGRACCAPRRSSGTDRWRVRDTAVRRRHARDRERPRRSRKKGAVTVVGGGDSVAAVAGMETS